VIAAGVEYCRNVLEEQGHINVASFTDGNPLGPGQDASDFKGVDRGPLSVKVYGIGTDVSPESKTKFVAAANLISTATDEATLTLDNSVDIVHSTLLDAMVVSGKPVHGLVVQLPADTLVWPSGMGAFHNKACEGDATKKDLVFNKGAIRQLGFAVHCVMWYTPRGDSEPLMPVEYTVDFGNGATQVRTPSWKPRPRNPSIEHIAHVNLLIYLATHNKIDIR
jgi:hypothetical protein